MSNSRYAQVALTYLRRPFASVQASVVTIIIGGLIGFLLFSLVDEQVRHTYRPALATRIPMPLFLAAFLSFFVAMHVKEQFADSRSHLTPDFRRVHIVVAAVAILILAVFPPSLLAWQMGLSPIGMAAVASVLIGAALWSVLLFSNWLIWPIILISLLNISNTAKDALLMIVSWEPFEWNALGLLALGAVIIVLAGVRCFRLNEDMPEYHRRMPTGGPWTSRGSTRMPDINYDGPWPRIVMDMYRGRAMAYLTRHAQQAARSRWSRIVRWQIGMSNSWSVWLWAVFLIVFLQVMTSYLPRSAPGSGRNTALASMMVAQQFIMYPMMFATAQLMGCLMLRTRTFAFESMLPVSRRAYVRQFCTAVAASYFQLCAVILACLFVWHLEATPTPLPVDFLAGLAAAVLLVQVFQFGIMVLAQAVTNLRIVHITSFMAPMFGFMLFFMRCGQPGGFSLVSQVLPIAAGSAVLGALFAYIAYRRLLKRDFD
jgi:hypothetical protein